MFPSFGVSCEGDVETYCCECAGQVRKVVNAKKDTRTIFDFDLESSTYW